jgi:hypothetical protein
MMPSAGLAAFQMCASADFPAVWCSSLSQRFAVNPRTFIVQSLSLFEIILRTVFNLFTVLDQLTDGNNNNDVVAITTFTQGKRGFSPLLPHHRHSQPS